MRVAVASLVIQRRGEAMTSAVVTGEPSLNLRSSRRVKRQRSPSSEAPYSETICGRGCIPESQAKRNSQTIVP